MNTTEQVTNKGQGTTRIPNKLINFVKLVAHFCF